MTTLYENCDVGLMTYVPDSTVAMPIKFYDYLVGGLAILNSLKQEVHEVISEHNVGLNYQPMNISDLMSKLNELASDRTKVNYFKINCRTLASFYESQVQYQRFSRFIEDIQQKRPHDST